MHSEDFFRTTSPRLILEDYLAVNQEVGSRAVLLQLAPFALHPKIKKAGIEQLFTLNPVTPVRHRAWFIWNTLRLSGLERHWYADELNQGTLKWKGWIRRIEKDSTEEERERWRKLLYRRSFPDPRGRVPNKLWTKGGGWPKQIGMARILVMREHLERPDCWYKRTIGEENLRMIERELWSICDPNRGIMPTQYHRAVSYTRARGGDFTGQRMSMKAMVWFFQMDVTDEENLWYQRNGRVGRGHRANIEW